MAQMPFCSCTFPSLESPPPQPKTAAARPTSAAADLDTAVPRMTTATTDARRAPCYSSPNNGGSVAEVVTHDFFDGIINQADSGCASRGFCSQDAFLTARRRLLP
ncbi:hypothetical protein ZIOFF_054326 [Zingiber officinale]|uniref:Uncharacterized protein n=1 Tax=Zingiber officinale TaxID=94328 RepID=A0A8J5FDU6_ZINOF|nr:hypothetical protein ZIOFF_054326 [Zingiber officinale]